MQINLSQFAVGGVLAGAGLGQQVFAQLAQKAPSSIVPEVVYLDFSDVDIATASFLRESVVAYRNHARSHWGSMYPVLANANPAVIEELGEVLLAKSDAFAICDLDDAGVPANPRVIGQLDQRQAKTLAAAVSLGEVDAPSLTSQYAGDEAIGPTAWNNRLSALAEKGILIESIAGRSKRYKPVLEGLRYGA